MTSSNRLSTSSCIPSAIFTPSRSPAQQQTRRTLILRGTTNHFKDSLKMIASSFDDFIPPPDGEDGTEILLIKVGPGAHTDQEKQFSIHQNLLGATSKRYRSSFLGEPVDIDLNHCEPSVFQLFYDWLYRRPFKQRGDSIQDDLFWILVYDLATYLTIPALRVMAFARFGSCFNPPPVGTASKQMAILPSEPLLAALFASAVPVPSTAFYQWILDHLQWHYENPSVGFLGADDLQLKHPRLGLALAYRLMNVRIRETVKDKKLILAHPNEDISWASRHGIDLKSLRAEATAGPIIPQQPLNRPLHDQEHPITTSSHNRMDEFEGTRKRSSTEETEPSDEEAEEVTHHPPVRKQPTEIEQPELGPDMSRVEDLGPETPGNRPRRKVEKKEYDVKKRFSAILGDTNTKPFLSSPAKRGRRQ